MSPSAEVPPGYRLAGTLRMDLRMQVLLSLCAMGLLPAASWFWLAALTLLRPEQQEIRIVVTASNFPGFVLWAAATLLVFLGLHEGTHGLAFWLLGGARPVFGFRGLVAYASAPGLVLSRRRFLAVGLAPLALLSVLGALSLPLWPVPVLPWVWLALMLNTAGSVGDLVVAAWTLRYRPGVLFRDLPDRVEAYVPAEGHR